ncbi:uncharacterized protein PITG_08204 [Phytophthora infestans T30-4]|uniref:SAP domain-containing protein n=1 Tax=Phytophthora infestans (strain T30-4) TaxID=403677 RepID=D0N9Q5_PHYIT|nr:uncharacterized protein PITG_08204 [Phytophthora infestans T30-4]EEY54543.1 conserved hypothetical protein [Phytophthora infestans T30-4]|eukprot:XP_002904365.1 conserved hypothetical protein [Phytophthora infestans T30-4]
MNALEYFDHLEVEETSLELGIDDVEQYLLAKARLEVPRVAERLMARIFGPVQHGIVSLVTGLFLCSHVASRVQILRAIVKTSESPGELEQASENRCSVYHNLAQQTTVQLVQKILGIMTDSISGASRSSTGSEIPSESALSTMKNNELQQLCRDQGLTVSGNKRELIGRLLNGESDTNSKKNTIKSPAAALLSAWFLAPISSTDMKVDLRTRKTFAHVYQGFLKHTQTFAFFTQSLMVSFVVGT